MWASIARLVCAYTFFMLLSTGTRAEVALASESGRITLNDAMAYALERNPELIALGHQLDAARGRVEQAGLAPHPELTINVEDALGSNDFQGVDSAETTVSIGWALERNLRERRVDTARANLALSAADAALLRIDVAAETARRFLLVLAHQARAVTARDAVRLAKETVQAVRHRVDSGGTPQADLARAQAELAKTTLAQEDVTHEIRAARHRLAAQWGETTPDFTQVQGDPFSLPKTEPFASLRERTEDNPDIARYLSTERVAEAALRLAEARRKPAWQARLGVRRMESTDDHALVAGITVPLALRNRNQGRIAEARADIERRHADTFAARVRIETTLFVLYEALQHSLHRATTLQTKVIPRLDAALQETRSAYERGRYSYLEWRTVQAELIDAQRALLEASIDAHSNVIEIERLTGVRVARPRNTP